MKTETLKKCILCGSKQIALFDNRSLIYKCRDCGLFFDNPRPDLASIREFYSKRGKYDAWMKIDKELDQYWIKAIERMHAFAPGGELLEVGAGIGRALHFAKKYYSVTGTELSTEAIRIADERYGISLIEGELGSIDFNGRQFDVILLSQILEHVQLPGATLDMCKSLLRPDGILFISVPNEPLYSLRMILPAFLSLAGVKKYREFSKYGFRKLNTDTAEEIHLSHFSEPILKKALLMKGFKVVKQAIEFIDPFMFKKGPLQVVRYVLYSAALLARLFTGRNLYNCLWIAAKKTADTK